jgi:16S rRNA (uracil1498-N3)-methyltransferase
LSHRRLGITNQTMTKSHTKARLYLDVPLKDGNIIALPPDQIHYLLNVLRLDVGAPIAVFNGIDGEYLATISKVVKKQCSISIKMRLRPQIQCRDLWLLFAPVKKARLDFIAQKASELGVRVIWPVKTDFCQISRVNDDRLIANAIEAAEQTERLDIAKIKPLTSLSKVLQDCENDRLLIWCDEASAGHPALNICTALAAAPPHEKAAVLIGPEGGFSEFERTHLQSKINCLRISLGPRILRTDTAAISALSCYQSICGDWQN